VIFFNRHKKQRKHAEDWCRLAQKIYDYRHDIVSDKQRTELHVGIARLKAVLGDKQASADALREACDALEPAMRACGGHFYPRNFWAENVEMILVAAILAIGIRTFFIQPFKIPTNSMFPTYHGMTHVLDADGEGAPAAPVRLFEYLRAGMRSRAVVPPLSGEIVIPLAPTRTGFTRQFDPDSFSFAIFNRAPARPKWPVLRGLADTYQMFVDGKPFEYRVPGDFDMDSVIKEWLASHDVSGSVVLGELNGRPMFFLHTGIQATAGEPLLSFRIYTGDQLFVDRFSYHWIRPKVGDPIVFLTDNIEGMGKSGRGKYYIKRLAGTPGDTLQIKPPTLYRNGQPATGAQAFLSNAKQIPPFEGYVHPRSAAMFDGRTPILVPDDSYFALGDNSDNSLDSRYWGFVPDTEIVGRALFIYYPFTKRWGPAK